MENETLPDGAVSLRMEIIMHGEPTQTGPMIQHDMTRRHPEQAPTWEERIVFPINVNFYREQALVLKMNTDLVP